MTGPIDAAATQRGILTVTIPGEPVAKGRPRFNTQTGHAYTPTKTKSHEDTVAWHVKKAAQEQGIDLPFTGPVWLALGFGSRHDKRGNVNRASDIDNYQKLVMDALNGVAYVDDVQVVMLQATIVRGITEEPWTSIAVKEEQP